VAPFFFFFPANAGEQTSSLRTADRSLPFSHLLFTASRRRWEDSGDPFLRRQHFPATPAPPLSTTMASLGVLFFLRGPPSSASSYGFSSFSACLRDLATSGRPLDCFVSSLPPSGAPEKRPFFLRRSPRTIPRPRTAAQTAFPFKFPTLFFEHPRSPSFFLLRELGRRQFPPL